MLYKFVLLLLCFFLLLVLYVDNVSVDMAVVLRLRSRLSLIYSKSQLFCVYTVYQFCDCM